MKIYFLSIFVDLATRSNILHFKTCRNGQKKRKCLQCIELHSKSFLSFSKSVCLEAPVFVWWVDWCRIRSGCYILYKRRTEWRKWAALPNVISLHCSYVVWFWNKKTVISLNSSNITTPISFQPIAATGSAINEKY